MKNVWIESSRLSVKGVAKGIISHICEINDLLDVTFGSYKACFRKGHCLTVIRRGIKKYVTEAKTGDILIIPQYLTDWKVRLAHLNNLTFAEMNNL